MKPINSSESFRSKALDELIPRSGTTHAKWILQVSRETQQIWREDFLATLLQKNNFFLKSLQNDFLTLHLTTPICVQPLLESIFPRWICPLEHQWPTRPSLAGFVEKAAQGLILKFKFNWCSLEILSSSPHLKGIATGLKGRLLQLKEQYLNDLRQRTIYTNQQHHQGSLDSNASNDKQRENDHSNHSKILSIIIDNSGLFAGLNESRLHMGTALTGGLGFLGLKSNSSNQENFVTKTPSRAAGKISEILALLKEIDASPTSLPKWLELGAAPGGMTQQLLTWGCEVTAIDLAQLSPKLLTNKRLKYLKINARDLKTAQEYNALLCDMNGPYQLSSEIVANLARTMRNNALIIYTLKLPNIADALSAFKNVKYQFEKAGLQLISAKHLFHNRSEITLILEQKRASSSADPS